jgi:hypothetical protein
MATNILTPSSFTDTAPTIGVATLAMLVNFLVGDYVLDNGLNGFSIATALHLCSARITQYSDVAVYTLGNYTALGWTGPAAGSPTGRKITLNAILAGTVTGSGINVSWAIIDSVNSRLMATGLTAAPTALTAGHSFSVDAIPIHYPAIGAMNYAAEDSLTFYVAEDDVTNYVTEA